jgi:hypothetical protein
MEMRQTWVRLSLFYFFVTAVAGVLLRSILIRPLQGIDYGNLLHAHSHLAILGWGYMALFLLIVHHFVGDRAQTGVWLKRLFWLTQSAIAGMFVSFVLQGYAFFSILFSTLHILLSYGFAFWVWRHLRRQSAVSGMTPLSSMFLKAGLICLVLSSLGPWTLAVLSANHLNGTGLYDAAIYFYLHFQYNGWFTLGLIAVVLRVLEKNRVVIPHKPVMLHFGLYTASLMPSYLLSVLWLTSSPFAYVTAAVGALLQLASALPLAVLAVRLRSSLAKLYEGWAGKCFALSFFALFLKMVMEIGVAVPGMSQLIYDSRSVVIGYLHLTLLGFVSFLLLSHYLRNSWLEEARTPERAGYVLLLAGFVMNELVLFLQGLSDWTHAGGIPYANEWLWLASAGMAAGIFLFSRGRIRAHRHSMLPHIGASGYRRS